MVRPQVHSIEVGDIVWVPLAVGRAYGTVVEDRGPLGVGGKRLFKVSVPSDPYEPETFTVGEDEVRRLSEMERRELSDRLSPDAVKRFLVQGGLLAILVRNSNRPVWLRRDTLGNVTLTFVEGYSTTGGAIPPTNSLRGERIAAPKKKRVIDFLQSFGLSPEDAADVVAKMGTTT